MEPTKMQVQEDGGINWSWFRVKNGNLVALFRLYKGGDLIVKFREMMRDMEETEIEMCYNEVGDFDGDIADPYGLVEGYYKPDVIEAFGWLGQFFKDNAGVWEKGTSDGTIQWYLEYHAVMVFEVDI